MPLLFIGSGIILVLVGLQGDVGQFYSLVSGDFTGPNNYLYWVIAIIVLGSLGYIKSLASLSSLFMALVLIVLLLDNKGFFAQIQAFINTSQKKGATQ